MLQGCTGTVICTTSFKKMFYRLPPLTVNGGKVSDGPLFLFGVSPRLCTYLASKHAGRLIYRAFCIILGSPQEVLGDGVGSLAPQIEK